MSWIDPLLAIAFVLILLGGSLYLLRKQCPPVLPRLFGRRCVTQGQIRRLATLPLTPHHALHVVQIGEREIIVTTYPGGAAIEPHTPFHRSFANAVESEGGE